MYRCEDWGKGGRGVKEPQRENENSGRDVGDVQGIKSLADERYRASR